MSVSSWRFSNNSDKSLEEVIDLWLPCHLQPPLAECSRPESPRGRASLSSSVWSARSLSSSSYQEHKLTGWKSELKLRLMGWGLFFIIILALYFNSSLQDLLRDSFFFFLNFMRSKLNVGGLQDLRWQDKNSGMRPDLSTKHGPWSHVNSLTYLSFVGFKSFVMPFVIMFSTLQLCRMTARPLLSSPLQPLLQLAH